MKKIWLSVLIASILAFFILPSDLLIKNSEEKKEQISKKINFEDFKNLHSINSGNILSTKEIYVFFDMQCPHCGKLFENLKETKVLKINWLPTNILNQNSLKQGAYLLSNSNEDAFKLLISHKILLLSGSKGIETPQIKDEALDKIKKNTSYFNQFFQGVPTIILKNSKGEIKILEGSKTEEEILKEFN